MQRRLAIPVESDDMALQSMEKDLDLIRKRFNNGQMQAFDPDQIRAIDLFRQSQIALSNDHLSLELGQRVQEDVNDHYLIADDFQFQQVRHLQFVQNVDIYILTFNISLYLNFILGVWGLCGEGEIDRQAYGAASRSLGACGGDRKELKATSGSEADNIEIKI